jgi:hypothetical protein
MLLRPCLWADAGHTPRHDEPRRMPQGLGEPTALDRSRPALSSHDTPHLHPHISLMAANRIAPIIPYSTAALNHE